MKKIYLLTFILSLTIPGFSQLPTTNLRVWYDADVNVTVNGTGQVTSWGDNTSNGFDASTILTGATLESVQANDGSNYNFVHFLGNSFLSSSYGGSSTGSATVFIVFNNAVNAAHSVQFRNINDSVVYPSANFRDKYGVEISTDPNPSEKSIGSGVTGKNFEVVAFRYEQNRPIAGVSTWRNGMMLSGRTAPDLPIPALPLYIGGYANATQSTLATADIAQIIIYDAALDETDMQSVYGYLSARYNIAQNQYPFTSIAASEWNDPATWAGGNVPTASDDVIIAPTGPFDWVTIDGSTASCRNLIILENSGLRASYFFPNAPILNVGVGNGYNNELAIKGSFSLDSTVLTINGNWYVCANRSDTLSEGIQLGQSSVVTIDGNNGDPAESVSADKALMDILSFNNSFSLPSTRLSINIFGKAFITIVDPHLDANGITINNLTGSYIISPEELASHNGTLQFGDGVSTEASNNPKGFVVAGDNFFPMKVIVNSNSANNRGVTNDGFVSFNAGFTINSGARFTSQAGIVTYWDVENNGTYIQRGTLNVSTSALHNDTLAIKGTGIFDMSDPSTFVQLVFTGRQDATIKKVGLYVPLTFDIGAFYAPNIRVYLHQSLTLTSSWLKSLMEEPGWTDTDPSYFIFRGSSSIINNASPTPVDTLRFYIGLEDAYTPLILAPHGTPDLFFVSVKPGVTNGTNKPNLLDLEWLINKASPGGNTDIIFQWPRSKDLFVPDSTTLVARHFNSGTVNWEDRTTLTDQNSFYSSLRQVTAKAITVFSPFSIGASPFVTLPVKLLSFDAEKKDQATLLTWRTAQEENSQHFVIERAADANRFVPIGTVAAAGSTNSITNYSFTDTHPMDGVNYYRLKQVDIDGHFTYSKTIPVNFGSPDKMLVSPNPANNQLNIRLPKNKRYSSLSITDVAGRIVLQQTITGSTVSIPLDIQRLPKGWYVLAITGDDSQQQTFLKQ
jgi:hypothetical protein